MKIGEKKDALPLEEILKAIKELRKMDERTVSLEEKGQTVGHILGKFKGFGLSNPQLETFLRHEIERRDDV